jgi:hypothetical protein
MATPFHCHSCESARADIALVANHIGGMRWPALGSLCITIANLSSMVRTCVQIKERSWCDNEDKTGLSGCAS